MCMLSTIPLIYVLSAISRFVKNISFHHKYAYKHMKMIPIPDTPLFRSLCFFTLDLEI